MLMCSVKLEGKRKRIKMPYVCDMDMFREAYEDGLIKDGDKVVYIGYLCSVHPNGELIVLRSIGAQNYAIIRESADI